MIPHINFPLFCYFYDKLSFFLFPLPLYRICFAVTRIFAGISRTGSVRESIRRIFDHSPPRQPARVVPFSSVRPLSDRSDRCMALMENLRARYTDVKIAFSYFVVKVQHAYYTMICLKSPVFPFLPAHPAPLWNRRSRSNPAGTAHIPSTARSSADSLPAF